MTRRTETIQAVVFQRDEWWIAVCLDNGLATQARTREAIGPELQRLLRVQIRATRQHGLPPFAALPKAPDKYWRMFENRNGGVPTRYELSDGFSVEAHDVSADVPALLG